MVLSSAQQKLAMCLTNRLFEKESISEKTDFSPRLAQKTYNTHSPEEMKRRHPQV